MTGDASGRKLAAIAAVGVILLSGLVGGYVTTGLILTNEEWETTSTLLDNETANAALSFAGNSICDAGNIECAGLPVLLVPMAISPATRASRTTAPTLG